MIFSSSELVNAEESDSSTASDKQILQETDSQEINGNREVLSSNEMDLFIYQVDNLSSSAIKDRLSQLEMKSELTEIEKEKVKILIKKDKEMKKKLIQEKKEMKKDVDNIRNSIVFVTMVVCVVGAIMLIVGFG